MRAPSHAPAVRYPLGGSRAVGHVLSAISVGGLACILAWLWFGSLDADLPVKAALGLGLWLICSSSAWYWWRSMPVGHLVWDGVQWLLEAHAPGDGQAMPDRPLAHLDLQAGMLLSLRPAQGRAVWLWLERGSDPLQWPALRRALYSPARVHAVGAAETMNANPQRDDGATPKT